VPDEYGNGGNAAGGNGGEGKEDEPISEAKTIDSLLDAATASAQKSFEQYLELGQRAMRRVADPKSVSGSVVDDAQAVLSLMARDALVAVQMWSTYVELSAKKDE